jgi:glycerophosphoryl diester phosphodiesterase
MNTIKFENKGNIKMVAHRGVSGLERENTCPAFVAAGVKSYYGIETDVHVTLDGKYIIIHDDDLKRVAGLDMGVETSNFDDLRAVRMTDRDGVTKRNDIFLPTLEEYLSICKKYEKHCVLELKSDFTDEEITKIVGIVRECYSLADVTFISFLYENLTKIRALLPEQSVQFLFGEFTDEIVERTLADKMDIDVYFPALTREMVDLYHKNGRVVNCWTVNTAEDGERLAEMGVDFITTNILE